MKLAEINAMPSIEDDLMMPEDLMDPNSNYDKGSEADFVSGNDDHLIPNDGITNRPGMLGTEPINPHDLKSMTPPDSFGHKLKKDIRNPLDGDIGAHITLPYIRDEILRLQDYKPSNVVLFDIVEKKKLEPNGNFKFSVVQVEGLKQKFEHSYNPNDDSKKSPFVKPFEEGTYVSRINKTHLL